MKKVCLRCLLVAAASCYFAPDCFAQDHPATARQYVQTITTYPFSDPNPIPLLSPVYPYFRFDGFTDQPVRKDWKVVELENDYIKVLILPQVGGKIWTAIEKSTGKPFLYFNHVLKFRDIAMRGPWTSGGLESNFGIIGHTPNCATPVDYLVRTNTDGSVSCFIGVLDLLTRSNWRVEINLPKDKAYFTTRAFWYNATEQAQPYYHWMNAGLPASGNLEFIYPGNRFLGHEGEYADWPINATNGKKINFYDQNDFGGPKSYHVFGKYTDFFGAYWHADDFGMARYAARDDKAGKKIWIWGLSRAGMIWEKLLTDTDGQYVETQSGRLFNQTAPPSSYTPFQHEELAPYQTDTWKEYWYPVLKTKGFVEANTYGAFNLLVEDGWVKVRFSPVQAIDDTLLVLGRGYKIYERRIRLNPLQPFADSVRASVDKDSLVATLGHKKLVYRSDPNEGNLGRPVDMPRDVDWSSPYGLYVLGQEASDEKDFALADTMWEAALKKDRYFRPALVGMAALLYRNMRYPEALAEARLALSLDTYDAGANYYYGLINERLGNVSDAKDGLEIAALGPQYRSPAYTRLCKIYLHDKDFAHALAYAQKALENNRYDMDALQMEAVIFRYLQDEDAAGQVLDTLLAYDPLNHFAVFEAYLRHPDTAHQMQFLGGIQNEMPGETLLELGIWYHDLGCYQEAKTVFTLCPPGALRNEWLAYLKGDAVALSDLNPAFSFPFRSETAAMIGQLRSRKDNWVLKYQLALLFKDRNRMAESKALLASCGDEPSFAPFYAVRAAICNDDSAQTLHDLLRAASLDSGWRYQKLLTEYYVSRGRYERALAVIQPFYRYHPGQYIMAMLDARVLLLNKDYDKVDAVMDRLNIIPFEGARDGRELYREALLMQAVEEMTRGRYRPALAFIRRARQWPEHLGVGKPYDTDVDTRLEDWMTFLCHLRGSDKRGRDQDLEVTNYSRDDKDLLERIVRFQPRKDNTQRNFYAASALVAAWAMERLGHKDEALSWLGDQCKAFPSDKTLQWCRAEYAQELDMHGSVAPFVLAPGDMDANARILEQLLLNR